jgi:hypothetical protein
MALNISTLKVDSNKRLYLYIENTRYSGKTAKNDIRWGLLKSSREGKPTAKG